MTLNNNNTETSHQVKKKKNLDFYLRFGKDRILREKLYPALLTPKFDTNTPVFKANKLEELRRADREVLKCQAHGQIDGFTILSESGAFPVPLRGR